VANLKNNRYTVQLDTLKFKTIDGSFPKKWYESNSMPWISALLIAVLTVGVNVWISYATRRTSIKIAQQQIENTLKNTISQFHATLNSQNRQDWINEVRNCISELLTQCKLLNSEFQEPKQDMESQKKLHEKVSFNRNKLRLLLSPHLDKHKILLDSMIDLINDLDRHMLNSKHRLEDYDNFGFMQKEDKIIEDGRELLYFEWQKIQNAKFDT
jgi:hypothetical protein